MISDQKNDTTDMRIIYKVDTKLSILGGAANSLNLCESHPELMLSKKIYGQEDQKSSVLFNYFLPGHFFINTMPPEKVHTYIV